MIDAKYRIVGDPLLDDPDKEIARIIDERSRFETALRAIAEYDLGHERSAINVVVLKGIAQDALYGEDYGI